MLQAEIPFLVCSFLDTALILMKFKFIQHVSEKYDFLTKEPYLHLPFEIISKITRTQEKKEDIRRSLMTNTRTPTPTENPRKRKVTTQKTPANTSLHNDCGPT